MVTLEFRTVPLQLPPPMMLLPPRLISPVVSIRTRLSPLTSPPLPPMILPPQSFVLVLSAALPTDAAPEIKRRVKQKEFVNKALYSRLSDLRKQIAMDQNVPPFIIFTNATLKDMAAKAPRTRAQMLRVAGVGEGKMQRYGDAFLRVIAAYEEDEA